MESKGEIEIWCDDCGTYRERLNCQENGDFLCDECLWQREEYTSCGGKGGPGCRCDGCMDHADAQFLSLKDEGLR